MGGVCCANEREKESNSKSVSEVSSSHKVRITFQSQSLNDFTSASTRDLYDDNYFDDEPPTDTRMSVRTKAKLRRYKSIRGDHVDEIVEKMVFELDVQMPIIRVIQGRYLIGTEYKMLMIKNETCMVRVGGGWEKLEEYVLRNQDSELDKIKRLMTETSRTYTAVISEYLIKYNADATVINNWQKFSKFNIPERCLPENYRRQ
jgi:hypothetical protein